MLERIKDLISEVTRISRALFDTEDIWIDEHALCPNGYHTHVLFTRIPGTNKIVVDSNWLLCTPEYQEEAREGFAAQGYELVLEKLLRDKRAGEVSLPSASAQGELSVTEAGGAFSLSKTK